MISEDGLKDVIKTYNGRRFIADIFVTAGLFRQSYVSEEGLTAFREGQRNLALQISALLFTIEPKQFTLIIEEWQDREKNERTDTDSDTDG